MVASWRITAAHGWQSVKAKINRVSCSRRDVHHRSLALGDFAERARKAVTRDVHPRRFARHKQIRIAPSFTMQPENTAAISHFAKTFLHANINLLNIDQLVISIESRRHDSCLFFYFIEKYYSFFSFFSLLWNVLNTNFPTVYNIKKVMI